MAFSFKKIVELSREKFQRPASVVGIDIGSSSVKVVQLRPEEGKIILETYGELATGPYAGLAVGQAASLPRDKLVELIRDLFKEANITSNFGTLTIPLRASLITTIRLPDVGRAELGKMIPIEARKYVPVPISEVALDWWVIPTERGQELLSSRETSEIGTGKPIEVLVAAIHKQTVSEYEALSASLGLQSRYFEIESFSAVRSALPHGALGPLAILDWGASSARLLIVDFGVVRAAHTINKGAQDITLAIARSLDLPFAKAEEIKRSVGLMPRAEDLDIRGTISPLVEYVLAEAARIMVNYEGRAGRAIEKLILLGGGSLLKGLSEAAKGITAVPLARALPFEKVEAPAFLAPLLNEAGSSFGSAIGLALRLVQEI